MGSDGTIQVIFYAWDGQARVATYQRVFPEVDDHGVLWLKSLASRYVVGAHREWTYFQVVAT